MALDYAMDLMFRASDTLAQGDGDLRARLQRAWTEDIQQVWHRECLTVELSTRFRALWETYTQKSDDPRTTTLRTLSDEEARACARAVIAFARDIAIAHGGGAIPGNYWSTSVQ